MAVAACITSRDSPPRESHSTRGRTGGRFDVERGAHRRGEPGLYSDGLRVDRALGFVWKAAPRWTLASVVVMAAAKPRPTRDAVLLQADNRPSDGRTDSQVERSAHDLIVLIGAALGINLFGILLNAVLAHVNTVQAYLVSDHMQRIVQSKSIELDLAYYENSQFFDKLHRAQREAPGRPVRIIEGLTLVARSGSDSPRWTCASPYIPLGVVLAVVAASVPVVVYRLKYADELYALQREKTNSDRVSRYLNQVVTTTDLGQGGAGIRIRPAPDRTLRPPQDRSSAAA